MRTRRPSHPGFVLQVAYMEPLDIKIVDLADAVGVSRKHVSALLHERASMTPAMAVRLAAAFKTTPELWLNLQRNYDLWEEAQAVPEVRCLVG